MKRLYYAGVAAALWLHGLNNKRLLLRRFPLPRQLQQRRPQPRPPRSPTTSTSSAMSVIRRCSSSRRQA
jgi:hypothetical protein